MKTDTNTAKILHAQFKNACSKKGYAFFVGGDYNLNIIGVRSDERSANAFDDTLYVLYSVGGTQIAHTYRITTDPGLTYLKEANGKGTAILVPNQYRSVYSVDLHQDKYEALCQRNGKVKVYRDANKDGILNMNPETIQEGMFGINIHRASIKGETDVVGPWSAGCQVFKNVSDFNEFMTLVKTASKKWGNKFTYTLLENKDISS